MCLTLSATLQKPSSPSTCSRFRKRQGKVKPSSRRPRPKHLKWSKLKVTLSILKKSTADSKPYYSFTSTGLLSLTPMTLIGITSCATWTIRLWLTLRYSRKGSKVGLLGLSRRCHRRKMCYFHNSLFCLVIRGLGLVELS